MKPRTSTIATAVVPSTRSLTAMVASGDSWLCCCLSTGDCCRRALLDLSAYLEPRRDEYYARLLAVSREGDWTGWITFFLETIARQAEDAARRAQTLQVLRDDYRARVATARSSGLLGLLVDGLFESPAMTIGRARRILDVTHRAATLNVEKLIDAGIVTEIPRRTRRRLFVAQEILRVLSESQASSSQ